MTITKAEQAVRAQVKAIGATVEIDYYPDGRAIQLCAPAGKHWGGGEKCLTCFSWADALNRIEDVEDLIPCPPECDCADPESPHV